jgi:hypothetical protein
LFEEYLKEIIENSDKLYYNFLGINRKEYPKWEGWKIINIYKEEGVDIKEIKDPQLDTLVRNYYYLKYIKDKYSD